MLIVHGKEKNCPNCTCTSYCCIFCSTTCLIPHTNVEQMSVARHLHTTPTQTYMQYIYDYIVCIYLYYLSMCRPPNTCKFLPPIIIILFYVFVVLFPLLFLKSHHIYSFISPISMPYISYVVFYLYSYFVVEKLIVYVFLSNFLYFHPTINMNNFTNHTL